MLQTENTTLRVERDKLSEELNLTKRDLNERNKEYEKLQHLVTELEDHVERLQVS